MKLADQPPVGLTFHVEFDETPTSFYMFSIFNKIKIMILLKIVVLISGFPARESARFDPIFSYRVEEPPLRFASRRSEPTRIGARPTR